MYLIVGCGFLGQYVLKELLNKTEESIICTYHAEQPKLCFEQGENVRFQKCDVTDKADLQALKVLCAEEPVKVFYFAAFHNIDAVYRNPEAAHKVNVEGLAAFLEAGLNIQNLFFASTDCVYGESGAGQAPFCESDVCVPINEYGRQKLVAEELVLKKGFHVLRFSLLYGPSLCQRKTFYDTTLEALRKGESVEMIDGLARNALSYQKAAQYCARLACAEKSVPPILNVCGKRLLTKYALGLFIAEEAGASPEQILSITQTEGQKFFADKRAGMIALENNLLYNIMR